MNPRARVYQSKYILCSQDTDTREQDAFIGIAVERNQLTGGSKFIDEVEHRIGLRIKFRGQDRPTTVGK